MIAAEITPTNKRPGRPLKHPEPARTVEETVSLLREVEARFAQTPEQHLLYNVYIATFRNRALAGEEA